MTITAPDGLICTAQHPAPVGSATVETIWTVTNVVQKALNLLLAASEGFAERAQAVSSGTMATFNMGGINQFGERFGLHLLDPLAGGSGAFAMTASTPAARSRSLSPRSPTSSPTSSSPRCSTCTAGCSRPARVRV